MRMQDEVRARQIVSGNQIAFEAFVNEEKLRLYHYCCLMVKDHQLAEEVVQDAFIKAYLAMSSYNSERASLRTWLTTIAHRLALNAIRDRQKQNALLASEYPPDAALYPSPEQHYEDKAMLNTLLRALNALPEPDRSILLLKDYFGFKFKEISEIQNLSLGTVKSKHHYAKQKLKQRMEADDEA